MNLAAFFRSNDVYFRWRERAANLIFLRGEFYYYGK